MALTLFFLTAFTGCGKEEKRSIAALGSGDLRWATFPIPLQADSALHDGGPAEEDLRAAIDFWESRAGKRLFKVGSWPSGRAPYTGPSQDPDELLENTIFFMNPWPFDSHIAGKTVIHSNGTAIQSAVIFLNSSTPLCSGFCDRDGEHEQTSRRKLLAHELGHFIGFAHVNDPGNIMYPEILPGGMLEGLSVDDGLLRKLAGN